MIWATPRSIIATVSEIRAMGGGTHPILGFLGVMSAKNTAVNILILTTFMSFLLYRRTGKIATVTWAKTGQAVQLLIFAAAAIFVIFLGVYGYFVEASVRIGLSVPQVSSVLFAMVAITAIDIFLFRRPKNTGETRWGRMPAISQYVLIFIAVTFTWLMGLMGYVRSGLRQHWHVYGVIRDTSPDAFTPTLGFATQVVSATVLVFFVLIGFVFWLASLHDRPDFERGQAKHPMGRCLPHTRLEPRVKPRGRHDGPAPRPDRRCSSSRRTAFYTYVGQLVPQKEVQPPQETVIRSDLTTADMVKVGREIMDGKGLCLTCHTIGKTGALRFPDLDGVAARAATRVPGLSEVEYFAQSLYAPDTFIVAGFNPGMPVINKPPIGLTDQEILCVIAYLQTLGGTATVTLQTSHAYYTAPGATPGVPPDEKAEPGEQLPLTAPPAKKAAPGAPPRAPAGRRLPPPPRRARSETMNIPVVLAILVVFGLLGFRRANLFTWAIAWWVGCYVFFRFGFTAPIPTSVISIYMGIVSIAILAFVSSSQERREEVSRPLVRLMTEKRYTPLLVATVVAIPALAAANVYVQMNVPIEPPFFPRTVHPASPPRSRFTTRRSRSRPETAPSDISKRRTRKSSANTSRTGAGSTTRTASSATATTWAATACSCTGWTRSRPTSPTAIRLPIFERRFCSGEPPREAPGYRKKAALGTRPCQPGRSS